MADADDLKTLKLYSFQPSSSLGSTSSARANSGANTDIPRNIPRQSTDSSSRNEIETAGSWHRTSPVGNAYGNRLSETIPSTPNLGTPINVPSYSRSRDGISLPDPEVRDQNTQSKVLCGLGKVCTSIRDVGSRRFVLQGQRGRLREKRDEMSDSGTEFMNKLNAFEAEFASRSKITELRLMFEIFQKLRDEYQELETDYLEDESKLELDEFRLETAENELKSLIENLDAHNKTAIFGTDSTNHKSPEPDIRDKYHPLVYEYLSCQGDIDNLIESLWELREEHKALLSERKMRQAYGLELGADALATVNEFAAYESQTLQELKENEKKAHQLKLECDNRGLVIAPIDGDSYSESEEEEASTGAWTVVNRRRTWIESSPSFFEERQVVQKSVDRREFINKWLLDKLCQSSLEILQLNDSLGWLAINPYEDKFKRLVLDSWSKDGTNSNPDLPDASVQSVQAEEGIVKTSNSKDSDEGFEHVQTPAINDERFQDTGVDLHEEDVSTEKARSRNRGM